MVWARELSFNDPYVSYYMRFPGFRFYPVVGISYGQAVNYCRWRTAIVDQIIHSEDFLHRHSKMRRYEYKIEYRLPNIEEWELAAAGGLNLTQYPLGAAFPPAQGTKRYRQLLVPKDNKIISCLRDSVAAYQLATAVYYLDVNVREKYYTGNLSQAFSCPHDTGLALAAPDGAAVVEYVYANPPNTYGLFNMIGNVAELTATPGIAKGGSWAQSIKALTLQTNLPYTEPHAWLGFRCAATVYISPKP